MERTTKMEWIEANPLPAVCQKCEYDYKRYQEAEEALGELEEQRDKTNGEEKKAV